MAKKSEGSDKKKQYKTPHLHRYGDFRTVTQGGTKKKNEASTVTGPKTKAGTG